MKNSNLIKKAYSNIYISKDLEEKILDMTINKEKNKRKIPRYLVASISVFVIFLLATTIVYAEEIKQFIESWSSSIQFKDGTEVKITENSTFKIIPETAIKAEVDDSMVRLTMTEVENMLGFKILKLSPDDKLRYLTFLNNDGSIGRVDLSLSRLYSENENNYISMSVSILNEKADEKYIKAFEEGLDATGEKELENNYISDKLGVKIFIYSNDWTNNRITATFCYNNILYSLIGNNISEQKIKDIIEELE